MWRPRYRNHTTSWFSVIGLHFGPNIWKHSRFDHAKWLVTAHIGRASRRPLKRSPTGWSTVGPAWMTVSKARLNVVSLLNGLWVLLLWALLITASVLCGRHQLFQRKPETSFQTKPHRHMWKDWWKCLNTLCLSQFLLCWQVSDHTHWTDCILVMDSMSRKWSYIVISRNHLLCAHVLVSIR